MLRSVHLSYPQSGILGIHRHRRGANIGKGGMLGLFKEFPMLIPQAP